MKKLNGFSVLFFLSFCLIGYSQSVNIKYDINSVRQVYAAGLLKKALQDQGYVLDQSVPDFQISMRIDSQLLTAESFSVSSSERIISIHGGDERGIIYGCLSLAEDLRNGIGLKNTRKKNEKPFLPLRAIKYDLPWDTYRHSTALSLHDETCRDTSYWKSFLDMMVENRINSLSLWNLHTYPFLIKSKNFPEASPWTDKEMKDWQTLFRSIFRMAHERAIDTYIIPFNIFVTAEFAKAHQVAMDNLDHHFFVKGDTSEIIKRYTRESVTQMLEEYPELTGIGLTLGEGMAGMTPQQREKWIRETIIEGMRLANRKSKLVHRIPFSSTTGSLGITSIDTEKLTRLSIEAEADLGFTDGPIWADMKFNWSHAHSTPKLIKVHGGKLYDTYFKPEPSKYKVTWTARNEDFFCLRWGVPSFVREHILQNTHSYSGGYFIGSETYIPAKDYFTKDSIDIPWKYAFERQWLFYKIWGRLLYNPETADEVFDAEFKQRYQKQGKNLLKASELAGKTALRFASNFDLGWDFTLYSEGMMALDNQTKRVEYVSVDRLINQPPLDTDFVSIAEFVKNKIAGKSFSSDRITPTDLINMLEKDCNKAIKLVRNIKPGNNKALIYELSDIRTWAFLGLHLAEKIRAGIALQTYREIGNEENKKNAVKHLEHALRFWNIVVGITSPLYKEMPLVHLSEQDGKTWQENDHLRFHWKLLIPDVERDIQIAKDATIKNPS